MSCSSPSEITGQTTSDAGPASGLLDLTSNVIPIRTGNKMFHIHENLITNSSIFFKNATKQEWRDANSKPIAMSDEILLVFQIYCRWLYTRRIVVHDTQKTTYWVLAQLYVLGERILDCSFQEAVIRAIAERCTEPQKHPSYDTIQIIYKGTIVGSPARRLMVDLWAYHADAEWHNIKGLRTVECAEFIDDLIPALLRVRRTPSKTVDRPWITQLESYRPIAVDKKTSDEA